MLILNNRNAARLINAMVPQIAERLAARPHPGDVTGDPDRLLTEVEAAALLRLRPSTLCHRRSRGSGPRFLRRRSCKRRPPVRYRLGDVLKFRAARATNPEDGS